MRVACWSVESGAAPWGEPTTEVGNPVGSGLAPLLVCQFYYKFQHSYTIIRKYQLKFPSLSNFRTENNWKKFENTPEI